MKKSLDLAMQQFSIPPTVIRLRGITKIEVKMMQQLFIETRFISFETIPDYLLQELQTHS
jgi:hypothetical protein